MPIFNALTAFLDRLFSKGKQYWLTSKIPKHFVDVDYVIETAILESIIQFWENDGGVSLAKDQLSAHEPDPVGAQRLLELSDAYDWARTGRSEFRQRLETATHDAAARSKSPDAAVEETRAVFEALSDLENQYNYLDTLHLTNIVKHRQYLWS